MIGAPTPAAVMYWRRYGDGTADDPRRGAAYRWIEGPAAVIAALAALEGCDHRPPAGSVAIPGPVARTGRSRG